MLLEWLLFGASCLVIVASAFGMRATAMKDRDKLRRPMTSFMFVDRGGPFEWRIVDIGSPMTWRWAGATGGTKTRPRRPTNRREKHSIYVLFLLIEGRSVLEFAASLRYVTGLYTRLFWLIVSEAGGAISATA